jgi:RND family efflux transporter MFP subunit
VNEGAAVRPVSSLGSLTLALLACWLLAGCQRDAAALLPEQPSAASENPGAEEEPLYTVQRGTVVRKVQFLSSVAPIDEQKLYFRTDGRIRFIAVAEGDWVDAGQVLAELEMTDLLNQVDEARVNLQTMQKRLESIRQNPAAVAEAQARLEMSQIRLEQARAQDPAEQIAIAAVELERARLALEDAQVYQQRPLKEAEMSYQVAQASYQQALKAREQNHLQVQLLEQEVELSRIALQEAQQPDDYQATADVSLAELALKRLQDQAEMRRIRAPSRGQVMSISKVPGSEAAAYVPVVVVADPSTLEVVADLMRTEVIQLHVGQEARIELADFPGEVIQGAVRRLPYVGLTGSDFLDTIDRSTRIQFDPPRSMNLKVGDLARATVVLESKEDVLYLPPEALRLYQGRRFVVVQDGGRRRRVDVKVGLESEDRIEIQEGLREGESVVGQ